MTTSKTDTITDGVSAADAAENDKENDTSEAGRSSPSCSKDGNDAEKAAVATTESITKRKVPSEDEDVKESNGPGDDIGNNHDEGNSADPQTKDSAAGASSETTTAEKAPSPPPRKRARTAYFIFADHVRSSIQAEHPGEGVAAQAKRIGAKWKSISEEEKDRYKALAAEEKEALQQALAAYQKLHPEFEGAEKGEPGSNAGNGHADTDLVFPVARIRKIAKLDPDVKTLSKEALQLVVKSAELALARLARDTTGVARMQNRRTLLADDVAVVCSQKEAFRFLKDDIRDLTKAQARQKEEQQQQRGGKGEAITKRSSAEAARVAAAAGSKPLTSYFGAASTKK